MFNFFKRKRMKIVRNLKTSEGHKAVICHEKTPQLLAQVRYHISIYSRTERNCIIYGEIVTTCLEDAIKAVERWKEIVIHSPQPIGLLKN